jgi:hypothetical protein
VTSHALICRLDGHHKQNYEDSSLAAAGTEICVCHTDMRSLFHLSQVPVFLNQNTSQLTRVAPDDAEPCGMARIADNKGAPRTYQTQVTSVSSNREELVHFEMAYAFQ